MNLHDIYKEKKEKSQSVYCIVKDVDDMKMCFLCNSNEYSEIDATLHKKFQLHKTGGKSWAPLKGHPLHETHLRWVKLLNL